MSRISFNIEARYDAAATPISFTGAVAGAGTLADPYVPTSRRQTTITLGGSAWF